jgi:hypothetical protein
VPERSSRGVPPGAEAGVQEGAEAELHPRLRLHGVRAACLRRPPLEGAAIPDPLNFTRVARFLSLIITKMGENIPNNQQIDQMAIDYT